MVVTYYYHETDQFLFFCKLLRCFLTKPSAYACILIYSLSRCHALYSANHSCLHLMCRREELESCNKKVQMLHFCFQALSWSVWTQLHPTMHHSAEEQRIINTHAVVKKNVSQIFTCKTCEKYLLYAFHFISKEHNTVYLTLIALLQEAGLICINLAKNPK